MEITTILLLIVTIAFIMALGTLGVYWALAGVQLKKTAPKTIDLDFLKRHTAEKEVEVNDDEIVKVQRYASTGLMQTGLSKKSKLTATLTERGRRLLNSN